MALEQILEKLHDPNEHAVTCDNGELTKLLEELQAAREQQTVKQGHWEEVNEYGGWGDTYYRCSVCGEEWYLDTGNPIENGMKFCPSCGARMDGEQNDTL